MSTSSVVKEHCDAECYVLVRIQEQRLDLIDHDRIAQSYVVSTAKNGPGQYFGSECTPTGQHRIRAKIGAEQPLGRVFVGRRPTGEIFSDRLAVQFPSRDWILSRILWLSGLEPGRNRFGAVDTLRRFIYIHGSPDNYVTGEPESHGCIRMNNAAVMDLFDRVAVNTLVKIQM